MNRFGDTIAYAVDLYGTRFIVALLPLWLILRMIRILAVPLTLFSPFVWRPGLTGRLRVGLLDRLRLGYLRAVARMEKHVWRLTPDRLSGANQLVRVEGAEHLAQTRRSGRGQIVVSVHGPAFRILQYWASHADPNWQPYLIKGYPEDEGEEWSNFAGDSITPNKSGSSKAGS